jgi:hypothetical protein
MIGKSFIVLAFALGVIISTVSANQLDQSDPEKTLKQMASAVKAKNWGKLYDCISERSSKGIEIMVRKSITTIHQMAKQNPESLNDPVAKKMVALEKYSGKEFFNKLFLISSNEASAAFAYVNYKLMSKEITQEKAVLTLLLKGNKEKKLSFIKQGKQWKFDFFDELNSSQNQ